VKPTIRLSTVPGGGGGEGGAKNVKAVGETLGRGSVAAVGEYVGAAVGAGIAPVGAAVVGEKESIGHTTDVVTVTTLIMP
jgi:hypothetical protein